MRKLRGGASPHAASCSCRVSSRHQAYAHAPPNSQPINKSMSAARPIRGPAASHGPSRMPCSSPMAASHPRQGWPTGQAVTPAAMGRGTLLCPAACRAWCARLRSNCSAAADQLPHHMSRGALGTTRSAAQQPDTVTRACIPPPLQWEPTLQMRLNWPFLVAVQVYAPPLLTGARVAPPVMPQPVPWARYTSWKPPQLKLSLDPQLTLYVWRCMPVNLRTGGAYMWMCLVLPWLACHSTSHAAALSDDDRQAVDKSEDTYG